MSNDPSDARCSGVAEDMGSRNQVVVRYWAAAREAAGVEEETVVAATAGEATRVAAETHPGLEKVLQVATLLVDGHRAGPETAVSAGGTVEILPPFAGG